jgi:IS5 family transposase
MLRTRNDQPMLWDALVAPELLRLPEELARVDALLDDDRFFTPFAAFFDPVRGRPSVPIETYLRLMFLKFRYRLGYESLCREVADSISWRLFCRIPLWKRVPHPTTLMKITSRCGEAAVAGLNDALLAKAAETKLLRTGKVRADTTVVSANIEYPTDSDLLATAIAKIGRLVKRVKATRAARRTACRDRSRAAGRRARRIASKLRLRGAASSHDARRVVLGITGELADLADTTATEATAVLRNARRSLPSTTGRRAGRLRRALAELAITIARTGQIVAQTRNRLAGAMPDSATRLLSLHDADARPIRRGRLANPIEFGYKAQVIDNVDGVILDHTVEPGNPADAPQLAPAIARIIIRTGRAPRAVTADRSYGQTRVETQLHDLGVATMAIPRKARPGPARRAVEHRRPFRKLIKWRTGCEGRISGLKHRSGWDRTRLDGIHGARTWCGHGVLTHNLIKIAALGS